MLKAKVSYSTNTDSYESGKETVEKAIKGLNNKNIGILYTSSLSNLTEIIKGVRSISNIPLIGSTSEGIMTSEGFIQRDKGYSSMMVLDLFPEDVYENLKKFKDLDMYSDYGFYESYDYNNKGVVKSYFAHHQGMGLLGLTNYLKSDIIRDYFHSNIHVKTFELLLSFHHSQYVAL